MPTAVIAAGYGLVLFVLSSRGLGDGALARLCLIVLGFAVPFIAAHAVLRLITVEVRPMGHALVVRRGFPRTGATDIAWDAIADVSVRRGPGGRLTGSGTLIVSLAEGGRVVVADLAEPLLAADLVKRWAGEAAARETARVLPAPGAARSRRTG